MEQTLRVRPCVYGVQEKSFELLCILNPVRQRHMKAVPHSKWAVTGRAANGRFGVLDRGRQHQVPKVLADRCGHDGECPGRLLSGVELDHRTADCRQHPQPACRGQSAKICPVFTRRAPVDPLPPATAGSFPAVQFNASQKPFAAFCIVPKAVDGESQDRPFAAIVRGAKADLQFESSFP